MGIFIEIKGPDDEWSDMNIMRYSVLLIGIFVYSLLVIPILLVVLAIMDSPLLAPEGRWAYVLVAVSCLVFFYLSRPILVNEVRSREILRDMIGIDVILDEERAQEMVEGFLRRRGVEFTKLTQTGQLPDVGMPEDERFLSQVYRLEAEPSLVMVGLNRGPLSDPVVTLYVGPLEEGSRVQIMDMARDLVMSNGPED